MTVQFFFQQPVPSLRQRAQLKVFLAGIFKKEKQPLGMLTYIFCSDEELLDINRQFLQHDYYTDIITFNLAGNDQPVQGEIYISVDRVKDNTAMMGTSFKEEIHRVIFHGALHLCGYKDKSKADITVMRKKEDQYLTTYFNVPRIPVPAGNK